MFDVCLDVDSGCDWSYEPIASGTIVATEDVTCCECGDTIAVGQSHDVFEGCVPRGQPEAGKVDTFHTCTPCMRIWEGLAGGDRVFGQLDEILGETYDLGLNEIPRADASREWEDLYQTAAYDRRSLEDVFAGKPKIERMLAGLALLEDFMSEDQIRQVFEWAATAIAPPPKKSRFSPRPSVRELLAEADEQAIMFDGFEDAIVGTIHRCGQPMVVAYSYDRMMKVLTDDGLTLEEAEEYMSYNVEGGWVGDRTPAVVHALGD